MKMMLAGLLPEALVVHLPEVDAQHEDIFMRIESLKAACLESGPVPIEEFESLRTVFAHHSSTEEEIAQQAGLEFSEHTKLHRTNLRVLKKALEEVRSGVRDGYSFMRYVELWFERHIIEQDQPFADSLRMRSRKRHRSDSMQISASI